ncbi:MAG: hypothetical protein AC479_01605, partial [miscellaneous Crenarchaeota group-6 archaeon AD8-1]
MFIPRKILEKKLLNLLIDDIGQGDLTSSILLPESLNAKAEIQVKQDGVVAGIEEAIILVESLSLKLLTYILDGSEVSKNQIIMSFSGDAKTILSIERTILNILSRMSGITTITNQIIKKLRASKLDTKLAATRKTVPGLNYFDKKAVFIGGGDTHRMNLADMILIKNNHIALAGDIQKAIRIAKKRTSFCKKIEVEVKEINEVMIAAEAGAEIIMFDNFSIKEIKEAVHLLKKEGYYGKLLLEASGGINFTNFMDYASAEVDIISLGELTHSVKSLDMSLKIIKIN